MTDETAARTDGVAWAPRRQLTLAQARRRSDMVRILRMLFTAFAAIAFGVLVGHVVASTVSSLSGARKSFNSEEIVTMLSPRFSGRDASGSAYVITAQSAQRRRAEPARVDLVDPKLVDELGTEVTAPRGVYDRDAQTLDLAGQVRVRDAAGYAFETTRARLHVLDGRVEGFVPLAGTGPIGTVRSDSYEIEDKGAIVHFQGNVEMTFYPDETDGAAASAAAPRGEDGTNG